MLYAALYNGWFFPFLRNFFVFTCLYAIFLIINFLDVRALYIFSFKYYLVFTNWTDSLSGNFYDIRAVYYSGFLIMFVILFYFCLFVFSFSLSFVLIFFNKTVMLTYICKHFKSLCTLTVCTALTTFSFKLFMPIAEQRGTSLSCTRQGIRVALTCCAWVYFTWLSWSYIPTVVACTSLCGGLNQQKSY